MQNTVNKDEIMSVNAFAKIVGVNEKTIRQHINAGNFDGAVVINAAGLRKLNKLAALKLWKEFEGGKKSPTALAAAGIEALVSRPEHLAPAPPANGSNSDEDDEDEPEDPNSPDAGKYPATNTSKRKSEFYKAKKLELEYLEQAGDLIRKADVYKALFAVGAQLRTNVLALPDRMVDAVMAARTRGEGRAVIFDGLEDALSRFSTSDILEKKNGA